MIIATSDHVTCFIPVIQRCKDCNDEYQLIIMNRMRRCIYVFNLEDISNNYLRYHFEFDMPECAEKGEYTYYLVCNDQWNNKEIDRNFVLNTIRKVDKSYFTYDGNIIVYNGRVLVTSWLKAALSFEDEPIKISGQYIIVDEQSIDNRADGEIVEYLDVLYTGILKYNDINCCNNGYNGKNQKEYYSYKG